VVGFANMHEALFRHFGVTGSIVDKEDVSVNPSVESILNFGVDEFDEYNEVVGRVDKVTFRSDVVLPIRGQIIIVPTGEFTGRYVIGRKLRSNGFVQSFEISRAADA